MAAPSIRDALARPETTPLCLACTPLVAAAMIGTAVSPEVPAAARIPGAKTSRG